MTDNNKKLSISSDDLQAPAVTARIEQLQTASAPQMVRNVGQVQPNSGTAAKFGKTAGILAGIGLAGGIVGAILAEIISAPDSDPPRFGDNLTLGTIVFTTCFAVGLGAFLLAWRGINSGSSAKVWRDLGTGVPVVAVGGAIGGAIAQQIYTPMVESATKRALQADNFEEAERILANALHFPRAIAFMLVGLMIGVGLGVANKSLKRGQNAVIGGVIGGFIGGYMFDYVGQWMNSDTGFVSRLVAMGIIGALVGFGIGLVDEIRRDLWLEIASGGMAGKQFIVWEQRCTIGSDPSCDITLIKDPAIAPQHVLLIRDGGSIRVEVVPGAPMIRVDGVDTMNAPLSETSMLQIGQTVLRIGQKNATAMPTFNGQ
jgi:hypothetical protein